MSRMRAPETSETRGRGGLLDWIEWFGNILPDPTLLFVWGAVLVMLISWAIAPRLDGKGNLLLDANQQPQHAGWAVQPKEFRQKFEFIKDASGDIVLHDGEPRIRLLHAADGRAELELTSDQRKVVVISPPASQPASASKPASQPDAEHGLPQTADRATPAAHDANAIVVLRGEPGEREPIRARNLLSVEGIYWALRSMVANFMAFAPLGVVLTGMLGIGVAEKTGLLGAGLRAFVLLVPRFLLTPAMVFVGVMSSMGIDAGYVVLPPLAAALYKSLGRSPLAGIAAVFAGVSGGFAANLFVTGLDPMLSELTQKAARVIDNEYIVVATCNWYFMIASTFMLTIVGWLVSSFLVEPRFRGKPADEGGPVPVTAEDRASVQGHSLASGLGVFVFLLAVIAAAVVPLAWPGSPMFVFGGLYGWLAQQIPQLSGLASYAELRGSWPFWVCLLAPAAAGVVLLPVWVYVLSRGGMEHREALGLAWAAGMQSLLIGAIAVLANLPGSPLYGMDYESHGTDRWVKVIVPLIFLGFLVPGLAYGIVTSVVTSGRDVAKLMNEAIAGMAPIVVLAFFAAQFIEYFKHSRLDQMLAWTGGLFLAENQFSPLVLIVLFIVVTAFFNLFVGSMSAKWTMFAPIFVPMLMIAGISPELTQAAYRVGDSVTNIITPLNSYLVIVLVFMQRYAPRAAMGTLIAMMLPYTFAFVIAWTLMLLGWMNAGWPLGVGGPLTYAP